MGIEKKVKVTKAQIESWIRQGVTKDKGSPNYRPEIGSLLEKLNCKQPAMVKFFKANQDLDKLYKTVNYKGDTRNDIIELEDDTEEVSATSQDNVSVSNDDSGNW